MSKKWFNDIAVICGTYQRARFEFTRFCDYFKQHLKSANIHQLTIIMTDGQKIIFVASQRNLIGMQCDVCGIDVFVSEYYHEQHVKEGDNE
jgi:hypothetical protein